MKSWRTTVISSVVLGLLVVGCGDGGSGSGEPAPTGAPCGANEECAGALCLPFEGGYCASDCGVAPCPDGETCHTIGDYAVCLGACGGPGTCRAGYMCFQGVCQPACAGDAACSPGFGCEGGQCAALPGKAVGERCNKDADCSTRLCDFTSSACQLACKSESGCGTGQTCYVNPIDPNNDGSTNEIQPICIARRGGSAVGARCKVDKECDRGQCLLGVCTTLCESGGSCPSMPAMGCVKMFAQLDLGAAKVNACLFKQGTIHYDVGLNGTGLIGMPSNVQAFNIFVEAENQNLSFVAGVGNLEGPMDDALYGFGPPDENKVRYQYDEGTSMMLVSNTPSRHKVIPGLYSFGAFAQNKSQTIPFNTTVRIKLGDAPTVAGQVPLHFFVTNLAGGCFKKSLTAATAPTVLASVEADIKKIFASAQIAIGPITYTDSKAPNSIDRNVRSQLENLLRTATTGDTPDALEVVLVKSILGGSNGFEILGVSGGIPASTGIPGTVHSGVTASLSSLCFDKTGHQFAITIAHELGHSMGLFHNIEENGATDWITDNDSDKSKNLMYWAEDDTDQVKISPQQAQVLLANPTVQP